MVLHPLDQTGYIITENNLNVSEFDVEIKCDESNGYFGEPTVSSCGENNEPYTFSDVVLKHKNALFQIPQDISLILKIKV